MVSSLSGVIPLHKAQNTTSYYYRGHSVLPSIRCILNDCGIHEDLLSQPVRALLQVCFLYNCRISELLCCSNQDVIHPDRLLCLGKKKSGSYIIFVPGLSESLKIKGVSLVDFPIFLFTYKKIWSSAKRAGLGKIKGFGLTHRVTHVSRFKIATVVSNKYSESVASDILHHRSQNSISYYTK